MLSIRNLSKTYGNQVKALDNVSLDIPPGMFGLLGPNGAGKSSLMRTIATLQGADSGEVVFDGINVAEQPQQVRATLGYLPQDFNVYPRISAYQLLDHIAILKGITKAKERKALVDRLLEQTNLHQVRKKAVATFSGGMRQRFGIAQALIGDPKLIIVDEPTAGLDPEERNRFHNLLADIGQHKVVILSTHIVEDVADLCPRMAVLADGRIQLEGEPQVLTNELDGQIWRITVDKQDVAATMENFPVISSRLQGGRSVLHVLASENPGAGFETVTPDLEDVYFATLHRVRQQQSSTQSNAA
ncbi:multidrug ABC transporter ATP-binding protein [Aliidiomarina minuta]|uniref:Multidrug ABC transporter ATP-binding protein n=1 Tax=Aliidiomarina minuta TaxID=880057 RepID=A0A432W917_9GAMM|nr:ABC transporter ATP-binding protein [Aliidiomarina minuta]RUO26476.1 multidrug ABC transporter ATP-binding protein [Aliidiomarina minuta]